MRKRKRFGRGARVVGARASGVAALLLLVVATDGLAQYTARAGRTISADHSMNGISAWDAAKRNGFTFRPLTFASGQSVTRPRDGVNTRLQAPESTLFGTRTVTLAQVVGGNASVVRPTRGSRTVTFEFFGGQKLAPGWKLKSVRLGGSYVWDRRPQLGTNDPSFRVKATSSSRTTGAVRIRSLTLSGPYGAKAEDAFVGRKTYTINGIEAWGVAKQYGFKFRPMAFDGGSWDLRVSTPHDGVQTRLTLFSASPLVRRTRSCSKDAEDNCIVAEVVGGNMLVYKPLFSFRSETVKFRMFSGKRLASGWTVRSVSVSGGRWVRRPASGGDDLSFELELTSYPDRVASVNVRSITLEGPSNATGWQEAFQNARNP